MKAPGSASPSCAGRCSAWAGGSDSAPRSAKAAHFGSTFLPPDPRAAVKRPLSILLVEDSEDDVFLMERAALTAKLDVSLTIKTDGRAAIEYLARPECGLPGGEPLPD